LLCHFFVFEFFFLSIYAIGTAQVTRRLPVCQNELVSRWKGATSGYSVLQKYCIRESGIYWQCCILL